MNLSLKTCIFINANVITLDPLFPKADWVAVHDAKIVKVGHGIDWKAIKESRFEVIDLGGKTILPGFIDAHMHIVATVKKYLSLDLTPGKKVRSISDIESMIHDYSLNIPPGKWIFGKGYNEFYLSEKRFPNRWDLDKATLNHPVKLTHRSGHTHVLNSLALKLTGITKETGDPDGGMIDRNLITGEPTGILYEMADSLAERIQPLQQDELEPGLQMLNRKLLSSGITSIHDASHRNDANRWNLLNSWKSCGKLKPRINMMAGYPSFRNNEHNFLSESPDQNQLKLGAIKIMLDDTTGRMLPTQKELNNMVLKVHKAGMQVAFHAIEEASIDAACYAVKVATEKVSGNEHRHRIEHCSVCPSSLAKKIASLKMMVVTQPPFIFHSGERYLETVRKEQLKHLYPIRTLLSHGIAVAGSSDSPVVHPDPLIGIYAAISRLAENDFVVGEHQKISVMDALRMYTQYAAQASFEETIKGTITPGKLADLVVLNGDPTHLSPKDFRNLKVEMTIIGGEVVWTRDH